MYIHFLQQINNTELTKTITTTLFTLHLEYTTVLIKRILNITYGVLCATLVTLNTKFKYFFYTIIVTS